MLILSTIEGWAFTFLLQAQSVFLVPVHFHDVWLLTVSWVGLSAVPLDQAMSLRSWRMSPGGDL